MKKISGNFEDMCLCFSAQDICEIRRRRLLPQHRRELFLASVEYKKFEQCLETADFKKGKTHFNKYAETYFAEWKNAYDFPVGTELFDD